MMVMIMLLINAPGAWASDDTDAGRDWLKMDPPPDVDKATHGHVGSPTCWLATAANMLAGAGYGNGTTVQQRADSIYTQLVANYGTTNSGWTDTALSWWLTSANNTWPDNPYTVVTVSGNKSPKAPWANALPACPASRACAAGCRA